MNSIELADNWSRQLGLARSSLLGISRDNANRHHAMLDGVAGSFCLSVGAVDLDAALDWTWSSQIGTHVQVTEEAVFARSLANSAPVLKFQLDQVDRNLEKFLRTISSERREPSVDVVGHIISCFRSYRHLLADRSGTETLTDFLGILDILISRTNRLTAESEKSPPSHFEKVLHELSFNQLANRKVDLLVTMRHAAGMLFQEAHAELLSSTIQDDLFGLPAAPRVSSRNSLGAYYTPPGIARTIADFAIADQLDKEELTIMDPACGSGTFLCEALRALERRNFAGNIHILGFDISPSAIEMARFALKHLGTDLKGKINIELNVQDFLGTPLKKKVDVVLTNPPFIPFPALPSETKEKIRELLGDDFKYRPDLSMAFTTAASNHLSDDGVLATLLPSGSLSQTGGKAWRQQLADSFNIRLVALLGDHGLFKDAMVNVGAIVMNRTQRPSAEKGVTMLWSGQKSGASSDALRALRKSMFGHTYSTANDDWTIYSVGKEALTKRGEWTPRPSSLGDLPERLTRTRNILTVGHLFKVELGVRAGNEGAHFQISKEDYSALPSKERKLFRPVAETKSIRNGRINDKTYIFYPPKALKVAEIRDRAPTFFERYLASLKYSDESLFDLARARRDTNLSYLPKLVSRAFISTNSFAIDPKGEHVVVQGYSWLPKQPISNSSFNIQSLLRDYTYILNSSVFFSLSREYCRIVAGGQVDASKSQISNVPLPDLSAAYLEDKSLVENSLLLSDIDNMEHPSIDLLDAFAAKCYGTLLSDWRGR